MIKVASSLALGWIMGTACQLQQQEIGSVQSVWVSAMIGLALLVCAATLSKLPYFMQGCDGFRAQSKRYKFLTCLFLAAFFLALSLINARCIELDQRQTVRAIEGQDLSLTGRVASLPVQSELGVRFKFEVHAATHLANQMPVPMPDRIDLNWYDRDSGGLADSKAWVDLKPGDIWQFNVRVKAPHGLRNPGGFDEELWLWEQGVMATGTVRSGQRDATPQKISSSWMHPIAQARQIVRAQIAQHLAFVDGPIYFHAGVIAALVMGDQGAISHADWDLFRATGVAHLMSISGLHITLFAWLVSQVIGLLWRQSAAWGGALCLSWPAPAVSMVGGAFAATLYALFAGWGLPAQRTILMLWVIVLAKLFGLKWPGWYVWSFAFCLIVFWDPWALMQAGFWLSFVAVGALMVGNSFQLLDRTKMRINNAELVQENDLKLFRINMGKSVIHTFVVLAREQWVVLLALTPLSILFFGQVSMVGVLANFIAIPWVTWLVTPLAMLGLAYAPFWQLAFWALKPLLALLNYLASFPEGVWILPVPPVSIAIAAVCGGIVLLQTWPWAIRIWGVLWMAPAFLWQAARPSEGQFDLWFADVGQGNAVIVRTAHHALLYDAGPQYSESTDAGQRVLVPFISRLGLQLDRLILSHRDADHTGGAAAVLKSQPKADLWSSLELGHPLSILRPVHSCLAGQQWIWDGVRFEFLHPTSDDYVSNRSSNSVSCVLRVDANQGANSPNEHHEGMRASASALLVGDIEAPQEIDLLNRTKIQPIDILLVPHHGSKTSSTPSFIAAAKPRWAVVQAGYRNRYGHPAPQVVQRYEDLGVAMVSTPNCGAAYWQSAQPQKLECERELHKRYWHYRFDH